MKVSKERAPPVVRPNGASRKEHPMQTETTSRQAQDSTVQSCQDSERYYTATTWACDCPDRQRHADQRCKHSYALQVLSVASAHAAYERAQTRWTLTAKGAAALAAGA
jgi:hypothetical protein